MRSFSIVSVAGCCLLASVAHARARHSETGSFLAWHVHSTGSLVREFDRAGDVRDRYERHFGHSKSYLRSWFAGLHAKPLTDPHVYDVYNVHTDGMVRMKGIHLAAGTWVFVDKTGQPVLKMSCGNPVYFGSDHEKAPPAKTSANPGPPSGGGGLVPTMETKPMVEEEAPLLADAAPTEPPMVSETVTHVDVTPPPPTPAPPVVTDVSPPAASLPISFGNSFGLGWLASLPILLGLTHHPHGSSPPPTPEPASWLGMALGAAAFAHRARKKKRPQELPNVVHSATRGRCTPGSWV